MELTIKKNLPIPVVARSGHPRSAVGVALRKLEVGDAVEIPLDENSPTKAAKARVVASVIARNTGKKFTSRSDKTTLTFWRTA